MVAFSVYNSCTTEAPSTHNRIFLKPQLFLSGYAYRPHATGESAASGTFLIRYGNEWTLNPDIFLSTVVTRTSPVLYREYSRRSEQKKLRIQKYLDTCGRGNFCTRKEQLADVKTYGTRIIIQNYAMPNCVHGQPYILHMFLTTREALQRRPCFTDKPVKTELSVMSHYDKHVSPECLRGF